MNFIITALSLSLIVKTECDTFCCYEVSCGSLNCGNFSEAILVQPGD